MIRANSPTQNNDNRGLISSYDDDSTSKIRRTGKTLLDDDFEPTSYDVLCGRDKTSFNHIGNRRFRVTIAMNLKYYVEAKTKIQKTLVVVSIVDMIRSLSPNGGFIKQDADGRWFEIGDKLARAKVGHALRDLIVSQKKSEERKAFKEQELSQSQQAIINQKRQLDCSKLPVSVRSTILNNVQWRQAADGDSCDFDGMRKGQTIDEELEPASIRKVGSSTYDDVSLFLEGTTPRTSVLLDDNIPRTSFCLLDIPVDSLFLEPDSITRASMQGKRVSELFLTMADVPQRSTAV